MKKIVFGEQKISIEDIELIAKKECEIDLNRTPEFIAKINAGADFLDNMIAEHGAVYGVTTGYGDSCTKTVPADRYYVLPVNLSRFHGCGLGNTLMRKQPEQLSQCDWSRSCKPVRG